jgi:hypothetical protein
MKKLASFVRISIVAIASLDCGAAVSESSGAPTSSSDWNRVNDDDASVAYSPAMQSGPNPDYYDKDMHCAAVVGEWCKLSFTGTGVKWIGGKNLDHGKADVYLDEKLDATVDTSAPSWLKQQELYRKTGLRNGPHVLMVQVKAGGFQDFDAFEYLGLPAVVAPLKVGETILPAQVPYLNPPNRYAIGSGVAMAVGNVAGDWSQLAGPGYSTPNLIESEQLTLEIDGDEQPVHLEMKRAAQTGIYYGVARRGDVQVGLIDYTDAGQPWLARLLVMKNLSTTAAHDVRVRDVVKPSLATGMARGLVEDGDKNRCGIFVRATLAADSLFGGHPSLVETSAVAAFTDPAATAFHTESVYTLETPRHRIAPEGSHQATLCHYFHGANMTDSQCITAVRAFDSASALKKSIGDWQAWFANVPPGFQLSKIKDERARTLVEGGLSVIKTNRSTDGGFAANISFFRQGFWRDTALGLRGLAATGHFDELKQWLLWANHDFERAGHVPDCAYCMPSLDEDKDDFVMGNIGVEGPAYVLLCARDYLAATHDFPTLRSVDKMLRFCMEEQLRQAVANGDKLEFNGDETEMCGAVDIKPAGTEMRVFCQQKDWSLSSVAICAASLDFFIKYVKQCGENPDAYHSTLTGATLNLHDELAKLVAAMDRDFWRTDVTELPGGFHDAFRLKADNSWPKARISNICLMPVYSRTPYAYDKKAKDVAAIAHYFDAKTGFLQLVAGGDTGFDGHDLGYLLWGLVEVGDGRKEAVYQALINGPTCDAWGAFNEAYDGKGVPNDHDLRTMETGVNVSAIAKYWGLGEPETHP